MGDWLREADGAIFLSLHVQPGAKRSEVVGLHGDALKIRLAAPAIDGRANAALLQFIAERLDLTRSAISLERGRNSRHKVLLVLGATACTLRRLLEQSPSSSAGDAAQLVKTRGAQASKTTRPAISVRRTRPLSS